MSVNKQKIQRDIQGRSGYTKVPNKIWGLKISQKSKIIYVYLISQAESWEPSIRDIALGTGYNSDSVMRAIKELTRCNMVSTVSRGSGLRNEYIFNDLKEWNFDLLIIGDGDAVEI